MGLLTLLEVLKACRKYWYIGVILALLALLFWTRVSLRMRTAELQEARSATAVLKAQIQQQNAAISELQAAGLVQASRIDSAVKHAAALKPRTTTIIREVYSDKTTDVHKLILNARND